MVYRLDAKEKSKVGNLLFDYKNIVRKNLMRIFIKKRPELFLLQSLFDVTFIS